MSPQVFLKVVATACREAVEGKPALLTMAFGVSLVGLVILAPLQLILLNTTLANSPAVYAVPLYQTILIVFTIVAGGTFFLEFQTMRRHSAALFAAGVVVAVLGLCLLSLRQQGPLQSSSARSILDEDSPLAHPAERPLRWASGQYSEDFPPDPSPPRRRLGGHESGPDSASDDAAGSIDAEVGLRSSSASEIPSFRATPMTD